MAADLVQCQAILSAPTLRCYSPGEKPRLNPFFAWTVVALMPRRSGASSNLSTIALETYLREAIHCSRFLPRDL